MPPIIIDRVAWSVSLSVTLVSPAKRLNRSRYRLGYGLVGPRIHVLDGSPQVLRDVAMATKFGTKLL